MVSSQGALETESLLGGPAQDLASEPKPKSSSASEPSFSSFNHHLHNGVLEPEHAALGVDDELDEVADSAPLLGSAGSRGRDDHDKGSTPNTNHWSGDCCSGSVSCTKLAACFGGSRAVCTLVFVLLLNFSFTVLQMIAAYLSNSLSLASDSVHMLVDNISYGFNIYAEVHKHQRYQDRSKGVYWSEVGAATFSAASLFCVTIYVVYEAYDRLQHPEKADVNGSIMLEITILGFVFDLVSVLLFCYDPSMHGHSHGPDLGEGSACSIVHHAHGHQEECSPRAHTTWLGRLAFWNDLNMCAAFTHVFADLLRSGVVLAGSLMIVYGYGTADGTDAWCSLAVSAVVLLMALAIVKRVIKSVGKRLHPHSTDHHSHGHTHGHTHGHCHEHEHDHRESDECCGHGH